MNELKTEKCRSCGAAVAWVITAPKGKRMPIDPEPVADGNIILQLGAVNSQVPPLATTLAKGASTELPRYKSHFATCPNAKQHRKKK